MSELDKELIKAQNRKKSADYRKRYNAFQSLLIKQAVLINKNISKIAGFEEFLNSLTEDEEQALDFLESFITKELEV